MNVHYTWAISDPNNEGVVSVRETKRVGFNGADEHQFFNDLTPKTAAALIRARRDSIRRLMSREGNIKLFFH